MTVLLIFAIVIAAVTVAILLFKVILETWALCGNFPKRLTGFRKRKLAKAAAARTRAAEREKQFRLESRCEVCSVTMIKSKNSNIYSEDVS